LGTASPAKQAMISVCLSPSFPRGCCVRRMRLGRVPQSIDLDQRYPSVRSRASPRQRVRGVACTPCDGLGETWRRRPLPLPRFGSYSSTAFCHRGDLVLIPDAPVRADVRRSRKPTCLLHPVERGAPDGDDLQNLIFFRSALTAIP
jgi:hypothetical protein